MKKIMVIVVAVMLFLGSTGLAQAVCVKEQWTTNNGKVGYAIIDKTCDGHAEEKQQFIRIHGVWHISAIWCWNNFNNTWDLLWEVGDGAPIPCPN